LIISITFHEFSHGYVANYLGDPTPKSHGRLTLNPLKHLDILGSLMLIMVHFGWAKPMPINPLYFKDQRKGMAIVGIAGPVANAILAIIASLILRTGLLNAVPLVAEIFILIIYINLILGLFNLIPIPPLDGSRVLAAFLPPDALRVFYSLEKYGVLILILALVVFKLPILVIIGPPLNFFEHLLIPGF
jgi:Zn-dependent protease